MSEQEKKNEKKICGYTVYQTETGNLKFCTNPRKKSYPYCTDHLENSVLPKLGKDFVNLLLKEPTQCRNILETLDKDQKKILTPCTNRAKEGEFCTLHKREFQVIETPSVTQDTQELPESKPSATSSDSDSSSDTESNSDNDNDNDNQTDNENKNESENKNENDMSSFSTSHSGSKKKSRKHHTPSPMESAKSLSFTPISSLNSGKECPLLCQVIVSTNTKGMGIACGNRANCKKDAPYPMCETHYKSWLDGEDFTSTGQSPRLKVAVAGEETKNALKKIKDLSNPFSDVTKKKNQKDLPKLDTVFKRYQRKKMTSHGLPVRYAAFTSETDVVSELAGLKKEVASLKKSVDKKNGGKKPSKESESGSSSEETDDGDYESEEPENGESENEEPENEESENRKSEDEENKEDSDKEGRLDKKKKKRT